ncbi:hypothetical protein EDF81_0707 [Enterobacter sp. BIGb0383]|uniref:hypothetical protein n=1 Tax=unclassified Enterobacter TaxID=2608935 RepID=UPI000F4AB49B|nr:MULTISPECIES: hypothetical protein [unclassified Enterobacter]ROP62224.1 hypothetical protein EDF81_0707 [Enterobacter sp. BIGb0383]ROS12385.1 hypothetical protein EC848_0709 [Enterobacter sp. BIGb0359]
MYDLLTLRRDIESLGTKSKENPFVWEEQNGIVNEELTNQFHNGKRRKNHVNDLTEYCWLVYKKALMSTGPMLIGRSGDLWRESVLAQFDLNKDEYLWKTNAPGNILMMDKWATTLNDAWVLGGIHRHADFHLMSLLAPENLWNYQSGYHVVTAREILGLQKFGYQREAIGNKVIFKCQDTSSADNANLWSYSLLMKKEASQRESSINKLIFEPVAGLNQEIQSFDHSRLRRQNHF